MMPVLVLIDAYEQGEALGIENMNVRRQFLPAFEDVKNYVDANWAADVEGFGDYSLLSSYPDSAQANYSVTRGGLGCPFAPRRSGQFGSKIRCYRLVCRAIFELLHRSPRRTQRPQSRVTAVKL